MLSVPHLIALLGVSWGLAAPAADPLATSLQDAAPAVRVLRSGGLKVESAALLLGGEQGGSLHVAVLPQIFPETAGAKSSAAGGRVRVPVVLEIEGATLLKGNAGDLLRVEVCLYAIARRQGPAAQESTVAGSLLETIEADLARVGAAVARSGLQYAGELSLAPGDYSLRVLVRNALTGEVGLRVLALAVPAPAAGPLLLFPAFPNPEPGAWVAAWSKTARDSPAALADGALPAAQPVLRVDQEARFELPVWRLPALADLRVEVLRSGGGRGTELAARIEARRAAAGLERLTVSFVPAGLEPGRYFLRAVLPGKEAPAWASPFVLLAGGGEGKVWAELLHAAEGSPREGAAAQPVYPRPGGRRLDAGPVRQSYRRALELLAAGDEAAARQAVAALETALLSGPQPAAAEDVAAVELGVAADLAAADPRSLLSVAVLHQSLCRDAGQRRDLVLAAHARGTAAALADLYARRSGDAAGRRTAARLLLALAAQLVHEAPAGLCGLCARTLQRALALDETDEAAAAAYLYLALDAERQGRYPEAAAQLERLLRGHPESAEGRLRLAVNLRRLGKARDADKLLSGLLQGPRAEAVEPWVLALAYHESGRALAAAGRLDDAERLLRAGLERLPGDEKLLLELAGVFDLRRDPAAARQVLAAFKPARDGAESARHRYGRPPLAALDRVWSELVTALPASLPALGAALEATAARNGS